MDIEAEAAKIRKALGEVEGLISSAGSEQVDTLARLQSFFVQALDQIPIEPTAFSTHHPGEEKPLPQLPTYVIPIREIRAALHPKTGASGLEFVDSTSASVFLPLAAQSLEQLTSDIRWVLLQLELSGGTKSASRA